MQAPRPTFKDADAKPGQDLRLGKGVTPSSAGLSAQAAAAGARLQDYGAPSQRGGGGLAEKIRLRQLQAAKWNGEPTEGGFVVDPTPAEPVWKPISAE